MVKSHTMLSIEEADYDRVLGVNLEGTFNICKSMLSFFATRKRGHVDLAWVAAHRSGGWSAAPTMRLQRAVSSPYPNHRPRVGPQVFGRMSSALRWWRPGCWTASRREKFDEIVYSVPLQRPGKPSDIAGACLFLASDLSAYVTGARSTSMAAAIFIEPCSIAQPVSELSA